MVFHEIFEPFIEDSPVSVMFRGTLENVFGPARLDELFDEAARTQRTCDLLFSTCADMMASVVCSKHKSINLAYTSMKVPLSVSVNSVYNKLKRIEPAVSERMVLDTATDLAEVIRAMGGKVQGPLPGYDVRIADGNHLAGTDHRIAELRRLGAAALPGWTFGILDPQLKLIEAVVTCEDGHASERRLFPELLEHVQAKQCWIADRNFCTLVFLFGIEQRNAYFVIRQHGSLHGKLLGRRKKIGKVDTGVLYEQQMRITDAQGNEMQLRRLTIKRKEPTEKGETEIHILTNLPKAVSAKKIAQAYRLRWKIETAFQELAESLESEINTLGYPRAALFGFCVALVMYNIFSVIQAGLRVAAGGEKKMKRNLSTYYLADEISGVARGMAIAIPAEHWTAVFADLTPKQLAKKLLWLAKKVNLKRFYTNPWSPKRPQPKRKSGNRGNHVSTYKILQKRTAS